MESLVTLLKDLSNRHPIRYIIGHSDVSPNRKPEPKRDPGPHFNWQWLAEKGLKKTS
jgi:N-acetyl-anhydromuramyl-L-alanine amidase AmpD